jgi:hypothetical protein
MPVEGAAEAILDQVVLEVLAVAGTVGTITRLVMTELMVLVVVVVVVQSQIVGPGATVVMELLSLHMTPTVL